MNKETIKIAFLALLIVFNVEHNLIAATLSDYKVVISAFLKKPCAVGEPLPLSDAVGKYITKYIVAKNSGSCYLEVGAGYGAITLHIVKKLQKNDHLDIIEIDPHMCEYLKKRFAHCSNVTVHCCSILDWKSSQKYDAIISTLPFNSFDVSFTQQVVDLYTKVAASGCIVSYVEYGFINKCLQWFYSQKGRLAYNQVQTYLADVRKEHLREDKVVYCNVPPLNVYHLQF